MVDNLHNKILHIGAELESDIKHDSYFWSASRL